MNAELRSALTHVAVSAQHLANDLAPRKLFSGDAHDLRQFAEWMRRNVSVGDARHVRRTLENVSPLLLYRNTPVEVFRVQLAYIPTPVLPMLLRVREAFQALPLRDGIPANTIDPDLIERLREAGAALEESLAFIPSELQREILDRLTGRAMTTDALQSELNVGRETLFGRGSGGLNELKSLGYIANDRKIGGYFRPDHPPITESN